MPLPGDLDRIRRALDLAVELLRPFVPGRTAVQRKPGGDPVTEADRAVNRALHELLPQPGDGWLSEETADDRSRLACERVWVVDPLDGTREFVEGLPEWCVSVALVEGGRAVAGGVCNPATGEVVVGSPQTGVTRNGRPVRASRRGELQGAVVLASRTEVRRGEWRRFEGAPFAVRPLGSVAYKLALVASGLADATWTLVPKHEWDVAAGTALVEGAGGVVFVPGGGPPAFNRPDTLLPGLVACGPSLAGPIRDLLAPQPGMTR